MAKRCRASSASTRLIPDELLDQGLQRDDVGGHELGCTVERRLVELSRRDGLVQPHPPPVPRLQLGMREVGLDLEHPRPEELEGALVVGGRAFEVQADLEPARAGVVPRLVMEVGIAEMYLHEPSSTA